MIIMKYIRLFVLFILIIAACQPKVVKETSKSATPLIETPEIAIISAESENVRLSPNGKVIGQLLQGDTLKIIKRHANWLFFQNDFFESGYLWAPSAGFEYINLYNPSTYYDRIASEFYPLNYFTALFGSNSEKRSVLSAETEILFDEIGLGSHEEIVLEVANEQIETVNHSIILYMREPEKQIFKIKIDFFRPIKGIEKVLDRCGLPYLPSSINNGGHVIWKRDTLIEGLEVDLERKEWESEWFSALWLSQSKGETAK